MRYVCSGVPIMPLGESLVKGGVINQEQLDTALAEQKKNPGEKLGEILLRLGYLPMEELKTFL
jgi:type IV pilus assembly protein PilB